MADDLLRHAALDPAKQDDHGRTPMHWAAAGGQLRAFEYFRARTDVTLLDREGLSVLHLAAQHGHHEVVESLLADPEFWAAQPAGKDVLTPLELAARHRHARVVAALISASYPSARRPDRDSPLHLAIRGPDLSNEYEASREDALQTVRELLKDPDTHPNERGRDGKSAFERAEGHVLIRRALLRDPRFQVSTPLDSGKTPLMVAAKDGDRVLVDQILERPDALVDHVHDGTSAAVTLLRAEMGDRVLQLVESHRIDPWRAASPTLLAASIVAGERALTESLMTLAIAHQPPLPASMFQDALPAAFARGDCSTVNRLLAQGATPDWVDPEDGLTALASAMEFGRLDVAELVLSKADTSLSHRDGWGRSALDIAPVSLRNALAARFSPAIAAAAARVDELAAAARLDPVGEPFYVGAWQASSRRDAILAKASLDRARYSTGERTEISERSLPYYRDTRLVRISDPAWAPSLRLYYLVSENGFAELSGSSTPIHDVNEADPIQLSDATVLAYLCDFCFFVRGDEGPFLVVDDPENVFLPRDDARVTSAVRQHFRPPRMYGRDDQGRWRVSALDYYGTALFSCDFVISPSGEIEMTRDVPLAIVGRAIDAPIR